MRIAILGAGPSGLSAAQHLSTQYPDLEISVFDQASHLGGLQRSFEHRGVHFDVGTILFFEQHGMLEAFPHLREEMVSITYRPRSVTPAGNYDRYPFSLKGFVRENGLLVSAMAGFDLLSSKLLHRAKDSVAAYAKYYMGSTIYSRSGLKNYIHRLHDLPDESLDVEFARKRLVLIERQSFRRMLGTLLPRRRPKTITGPRLVRPAKGFAYMYDSIRAELESRKVDLQLSRNIDSVAAHEGGFSVNVDGEPKAFDRVVSTIPIPSMLRLMGEQPSTDIQCKNLISLFYTGKFAVPGNTFFNFTFEADWKRITCFSRFYDDGPNGEDYFTVEVTTDDTSEAAIKHAVESFERHAAKIGLLKDAPELQGTHVSLDAYPVYRKGQMGEIELEKQRLRDLGIDLLGRQGNFEYVVSNIVAKRAKALADGFAKTGERELAQSS